MPSSTVDIYRNAMQDWKKVFCSLIDNLSSLDDSSRIEIIKKVIAYADKLSYLKMVELEILPF